MGLSFYLEKLFVKSKDPILEKTIYQDYKTEYEFLNTLQGDAPCIVFLGDSITARFKIKEYFPGKPVLNRGIFSDTTFGLLNRIENNCNNLNVEKCFILIGYNDLKYRDNDEILKNYDMIARKVHSQEIYLLSLLPLSKIHENYNKRVSEINERIRHIAFKYRCTYLDIHNKFINLHGYMRTELSTDGVHPNKDGYLELKEALEFYMD